MHTVGSGDLDLWRPPRKSQSDCRRARQRDGPRFGQPRFAAFSQQSNACGMLVRGAQGRRNRRHHDAAAALARARPDLQQDRSSVCLVRRAPRRRTRGDAVVMSKPHADPVFQLRQRPKPGTADDRSARCFRQYSAVTRRRRTHCIHLRHNRPRQGDHAFSSRRAGDLRLLSGRGSSIGRGRCFRRQLRHLDSLTGLGRCCCSRCGAAVRQFCSSRAARKSCCKRCKISA